MQTIKDIKRLDRIIKGLNELADQYEGRGNHTRASTLRFQAEVVKEGERLALMNEAGIEQRQVSTDPHDLCRCGHERGKHGNYGCWDFRTYDGDRRLCGCKSFLTDPHGTCTR